MANENRNLGKLLFAFAQEIFNFYERVNALLRESIPGLSRELLIEWEREVGLPDQCSLQTGTLEERARVVHTKYTANYSGMSAKFFIDYAAAYGSTVEILYYTPTGQPFRVDTNRVTTMPITGIDGSRLYSYGASFTWITKILKTDPNKNYLKCRFQEMNPAHMVLVWEEIDSF